MRRQRTHFAHSACHSSKYDGVSLRRRGQRTCLCAIGGSFQMERPKPGFVPTAAAVVRVQPAATLSSTSQYPPCAQCCTDTERSTLHIRHAGIENAIMSTQSARVERQAPVVSVYVTHLRRCLFVGCQFVFPYANPERKRNKNRILAHRCEKTRGMCASCHSSQ